MGFSLSVVIPTYNETHRLPQTLDEIRPYLDRRFESYEVIVADGASTDGTADLVRTRAAAWPQLQIIEIGKKLGKGAGVRAGVLAATCDLVLFMDADHATPIEEMDGVVLYFEGGVDRAVVGVRAYDYGDSKWRRVISLGLQLLTHTFIFERAVMDSQCGFKCFGRATAHRVFGLSRIKGGMFDVELFAILQRSRIAIDQQPVHWESKAGSRINVLRCMIGDPFDLIAIARNRIAGRYGPHA